MVHVTVTFKSGMVLCLHLNSRSRWFVHHWENYTSRVFQILSFIYGNGFEIVKVNKVFHLNPILQKKRCQILPTVALVVCWSKHCANVFVLLCLLSTNCHSLLFQKVHVLKQHWRLFMAYSKASVFLVATCIYHLLFPTNYVLCYMSLVLCTWQKLARC